MNVSCAKLYPTLFELKLNKAQLELHQTTKKMGSQTWSKDKKKIYI